MILQKQWSTSIKSWAIVIFVWNSHNSCQNFITLERKKHETNKSKKPVDTDVCFDSRVNPQGNLITASAEFDVAFDFAIYLCSQKYNRKTKRSKTLPKCFSLMVTFYIDGCFHVANCVADGKILYPKNFPLLCLKTVHQYLFTFASIFVLHKAG